MRRLSELETPCLVLDKNRLQRNISAMKRRVSSAGVSLRPHGKTAKSAAVMELVSPGAEGGVTASTLKEAEYLFERGFEDIIYAVGMAPAKAARAAGLIKAGADLALILDSLEQARMIAAKGVELGVTFPCLIELDCDGHRAGLAPDDPLVIEIGRYLHEQAGASLRGVLTHAGGSYGCRDIACIKKVAADERAAALKAASALQAAGLPCEVLSIGSTPTATFAEDLSGVTEVRAGAYMFQDLVMVGLGVCGVGDVALSCLASIIGHQKKKNWLMVDAGALALSKDRGTSDQAVDQGYGLVCDVNGDPADDLIVVGVNQEHGMIAGRDGGPIDFESYPIGGMVRILPNHACMMAAAHERYHVVAGDDVVIDVWERINFW